MMNKLLTFIKKKEIFARLLLLSSACTAAVCLLTIVVLISKAQTTYTSSYKESNDIIVSKIQNDYEQLIQNINQSFDYIEKNNYIENFLTAPKNDAGSIISLKKELRNATYISKEIPANLILIGFNGRSFYQNETTSVSSVDELLNSSLVEKINKNASLSQIYYKPTGMTTADYSAPGILFARKLVRENTLYGYAFFFIPEKSFSDIYQNSLDSTLHSVLIVDDHDSIVVSATEKSNIGTKINTDELKKKEQIKLSSFNFTLYDSINQKILIKNMNLQKTGFLIFLFSIFLTSIFSFFLFKKITSPIYSLMDNLTNVTTHNLNNKIELTGTYETQELSKTYNMMLTNLEVYINELLEAEKENHLMEIKALQMQIHPHFIYNTLTAIKFLSWKGEQDKVVEAIDSFINLLQQTFNNQEIVTLETEIAISRDYINLLKIRYGSQIETFIFADKNCKNILLPKMIIQPIIENSYLHAFPDGKIGTVQIFAKQKNEQLLIDIIDNGIGFNDQLISKKNQNIKNSRNYSSIGLTNIHDRIKLMYGEEYGAFVHSKLEQGTVVSLVLPINYAKTEK